MAVQPSELIQFSAEIVKHPDLYAKWLLWNFLQFVMRVDLEIVGNLQEKKAVLAIAPHTEHPDTVVTMLGLGHHKVTRTQFVAKGSYWKIPQNKLVAQLFGPHFTPVSDDSIEGLKEAARLLSSDEKDYLGVLVQGTRDASEQKPIEPGIVWFATQLGVPIIPVVLYGQRFMPKGEPIEKTVAKIPGRWVASETIKKGIAFLDPIEPGLASKGRDRKTNIVRVTEELKVAMAAFYMSRDLTVPPFLYQNS